MRPRNPEDKAADPVLLTTKADLADRVRSAADLVECALLAGGVRHDTFAAKLDLVAMRLRGVAGLLATIDFGRDGNEWLSAIALEARRLRAQIDTCLRCRALEDPYAAEDLGIVSDELERVARDAIELLLALTEVARQGARGAS